ncbi:MULTISPECIES: alpha/beta fold hydrolase [Acidiplasma]|jgi:pimeloyl-ACP methyl ester carboxylesterase|uniref:AB hydrolase-1 domain-containing protein n=2 Tax=Acidiplasma TaxID=507753 RepID=A0A0Q1B6Q1_9ARCH|nr:MULTISPECIES: alpha/beta hydrolase [Acidiplasma]KJE49185.1 hypothetical protein TZ01_03645 [Acidiplasma sp. MBA-1]KPV46904.1 hypothetical protein SE19_03430 [Acidiplasma aeolicum]KQB35789.1 hypothetical protein AOG55_05710 [Acidiplasma cupricumulans]KQB35988.1 hypothetical protein AOG54_02420 [Acidiplasma aeolicum]WMT54866.1 MAG: alpha/beta hydrolase [Acidiplasma sp.]
MERKYFDSTFGKISYLTRDGEYPVYFLHGFGSTGNVWLKTDEYINKKIMPFYIDLLGHGHSDKPDIQYTVKNMADAIIEFINSQKYDKFSIVGHSYGGWIALKIAILKNPENLILIDSAGISPTLSEEYPDTYKDIIKNIVRTHNYKNENALINIMEINKNSTEKLTDNDLMEINCNTVIIWGSEDKTLDIKYGKMMNERIKNSKLYIIDGAGHTPQYIRPDKIAEIINNTLKF